MGKILKIIAGLISLVIGNFLTNFSTLVYWGKNNSNSIAQFILNGDPECRNPYVGLPFPFHVAEYCNKPISTLWYLVRTLDWLIWSTLIFLVIWSLIKKFKKPTYVQK